MSNRLESLSTDNTSRKRGDYIPDFETVSVLLLFLKVPWFGLQCATVVFPGHTVSPV